MAGIKLICLYRDAASVAEMRHWNLGVKSAISLLDLFASDKRKLFLSEPSRLLRPIDHLHLDDVASRNSSSKQGPQAADVDGCTVRHSLDLVGAAVDALQLNSGSSVDAWKQALICDKTPWQRLSEGGSAVLVAAKLSSKGDMVTGYLFPGHHDADFEASMAESNLHPGKSEARSIFPSCLVLCFK